MTKAKARKHLINRYEHLNSWREQYVKMKKENMPNCVLNDIREEIEYCKRRIADLQRYAY